ETHKYKQQGKKKKIGTYGYNGPFKNKKKKICWAPPPPPPAVAATASAVTTTTASITGSFFARTRLIDCQRATVNFCSVQLDNCLLSVFGAHFDKSKSLGPTSIAVSNYAHRINLTNLLKQVRKINLCRLIRQISNINSLRHFSPKSG